ncbi:putative RNA-directed DNA polymerase, eukaryota, reverse transcriptase zinc-binding domain protein [Tanacetum coccineum]
MLSQELMRNYHRRNGHSKVAFKIDIQKAYDSVDWGFLRNCLVHFGFPWKMINWIMSCLISPSFTISVNGDHCGYFKGMRGLRQGDPLSPYLFTLIMEVLSLLIKQKIQNCMIKSALEEFSRISGLKPSMEKSLIFFGNVPDPIKASILDIMPFSIGTLPIKYLGVPLISSRLSKQHCIPLIDKVKMRGKAKMKWKDVCSLKEQGGLGIKSLKLWNVALMSKHIWNIVSKKDSLWVKWVNSYRLIDRRAKERNFWDIPVMNDVCWGWKKILLNRDLVRDHIVTRIGNGKDTSVWFDDWTFLGPLCQFISNRDIYEAGISLSCKIANVVKNEEWIWHVC